MHGVVNTRAYHTHTYTHTREYYLLSNRYRGGIVSTDRYAKINSIEIRSKGDSVRFDHPDERASIEHASPPNRKRESYFRCFRIGGVFFIFIGAKVNGTRRYF